ncbi:MAG: hypothetical protein AABW68_01605 [archaeon]
MKPWLASFALPLVRDSGWEIFVLTGTRDTKSALDTLKKISPSGGFFQVLSPSHVGSFSHLAWAAYGTFLSLARGNAHYSQPELEFLVRVAGVSQVDHALPLVGVSPSAREVIVLWSGPSGWMTSSRFASMVKEWGLAPHPIAWGSGISPPSDWSRGVNAWAMERSALVD